MKWLCALLLVTSSARAGSFSLTELDALLEREPEHAVDLVPLLPDELRQNFTFVYASRSPFAASITPSQPRVILFSNDARFVMTFIGSPTAPGHDVLEVLAFDDATHRFVPSVRTLNGATGPAKDATTCARCHGADTRPIFDSYPLWPGFYGSVEDTFAIGVPSSARELADYTAFLGTSAQHGVYAQLRWVQGSRTSPYLPPRTLSSRVVAASANELVYQPNTRLGMALGELNRKRIFRKLSASARFRDNEPGLLAMLLACDGHALPSRDVQRDLERENVARLLRLGVHAQHGPHVRMQELSDVDSLTRLVALAERAGVDRSDWSMALEPSSLSFYDGMLGAEDRGRSYYVTQDLIVELLRDLAGRDAVYAPFFVENAVLSSLGYPFAHKPDLARARAACPTLADRAGSAR
ncbi:MAG: hypothetical protein ABI321_02910 [Polyangia bacterium]